MKGGFSVFTLGEMFASFVAGMLSTSLMVTLGTCIERIESKKEYKKRAILSPNNTAH